MLYFIDALLTKLEAQDIITQAMICDLWTDGNASATYEEKDTKKIYNYQPSNYLQKLTTL